MHQLGDENNRLGVLHILRLRSHTEIAPRSLLFFSPRFDLKPTWLPDGVLWKESQISVCFHVWLLECTHTHSGVLFLAWSVSVIRCIFTHSHWTKKAVEKPTGHEYQSVETQYRYLFWVAEKQDSTDWLLSGLEWWRIRGAKVHP